MNRIVLLSPLAACLLGCASSYQFSGSTNAAEFVLASRSDSTGTFARNTYAWAFANENCEPSKHGTILGTKFGNAESARSVPVKIATGEDFVFTAVYSEARFGQNRHCANTGTFTPLPGHKYVALVIASNNVAERSLGVYDETSGSTEEPSFSMPPHACMDNSNASPPNSRPVWGNIRVRVNTVPAK